MPGELVKDVSVFESQALSGIVSGTAAVDVGAAVVAGGAAVVAGGAEVVAGGAAVVAGGAAVVGADLTNVTAFGSSFVFKHEVLAMLHHLLL